jgi:hypothetical protein
MIAGLIEKIFLKEIPMKYLPKLVINCAGCDNIFDLHFL